MILLSVILNPDKRGAHVECGLCRAEFPFEECMDWTVKNTLIHIMVAHLGSLPEEVFNKIIRYL